ncbi:hypothetical protein [Xenorhabdus innexi]|uniref:N-acetyltransferase n=1 Tax=Xenorhabdus innexi TaxID=290109 RepID=A0A1N6N1M7_9GAMM|nr:hypothetical protein [Xenorhabdus innexi]PHM37232.1 N-acetyltransferase [Xenorhabdus innexi]SIP74985.1 conserved hypothetical protein [Xenorhabdus innexi]
MYRSKSFNIYHTVDPGSLARANSFSGRLSSVDIRASIVIKIVNQQDAINAAKRVLTETMSNNWDSFISAENQFRIRRLDEEQCRWISRYKNARNIFDYIIDSCEIDTETSSEQKHFIIAYFRGVPIGILYLLIKESNVLPEVVFLVTHCSIRGCGALLVERAINKSLELGKGADIRLLPLEDENVISAYENMGFMQSHGEMVLYPAQCSAKWRFNAAKNCYKYLFC